MGKFDWKRTAEKVGWSLAFVVVSGVLSIATDNPKWMFLVPVLEGVRNVLKHKDKLW